MENRVIGPPSGDRRYATAFNPCRRAAHKKAQLCRVFLYPDPALLERIAVSVKSRDMRDFFVPRPNALGRDIRIEMWFLLNHISYIKTLKSL